MSARPLASPATTASAPPAAPEALGVVMLLGWNGIGGTQRQAFRLCAELRSLGVTPFILTWRPRGDSGPDVPDHLNVLHHVGWSPTPGMRALAFLAGSFLWMVRHRRSFQVIHAHNLPTALTAALIGPLLRRPVIAKLPNAICIKTFAERRLGRLRWLLLRRLVHRFVALTPEVERGLMAKGVRADRIVTIPNGVETSNGHQLPEPGTAKRMFGLRPQTRTVLYLGRLVADKGIAWLLEAWADLLPDHPECRLLVVGDGPEAERLQALSRQLGLISAVRFLGHRHDVEAVLSIGDILVLPSRSEGMSNALLEAMSRGLAVIATDVPGNRAVVDHDRDGLLVPHGDRGALRQALGALLADEPRRRALGRRAAAKMASTFSIEAVARAYDRLYRELGGDRA